MLTKNHNFKKTLPISWRISLHVAGISFLLSLIIILCLAPFEYARMEKEVITEAKILAEVVSSIYQKLGDNEPHDYARKLLLRMARMRHVSLVNIQDKQGFVRYSTDSRELGKITSFNYGVIKENNDIIVTYNVTNPASSIGSVSVIIENNLMLYDTHKFLAQIAIAIFIIIFIFIFLTKGLVESLVSNRINKLNNLIAVSLEQKYFLNRANIDRYDEIGEVAFNLNQLLSLITKVEANQLEKDNGLKEALLQKNIRLELEEALEQLKKSNENLYRKVQAQELLMQATHSLGGTLKKEMIVERLLGLIEEKLHWPQVAIFLSDFSYKERPFLKIAGSFGMAQELITASTIEFGEGIIGIVAQTAVPILISDLEQDENLQSWDFYKNSDFYYDKYKSGSLMAVPMLNKGTVIGVMVFFHPQTKSFDEQDAILMSSLGAQASLAIVNADLYEQTLELSICDPLTSVQNRRAMVKQIEYELARIQRFNHTMSLLLIDIDFFKSYNDRMGHVFGDMALKEVATTLKNNIRKVDFVARFGGEEFCVILPQTNIESALEVSNKLLDEVRKIRLVGVEQQALGYLSVSIGITVIPKDYNDLSNKMAVEDIISLADKALYEAKRTGRDKVVYLG